MIVGKHDYRYMSEIDVMRLSALGLLQYAQYDSHVYYVDPAASNVYPDQSGRHFDSPLKEIDDALDWAVDGRGDIILIKGSTTNITEVDVSIAKSRLVIACMVPPETGRCIIKPTADPSTAILSITAAADKLVLQNLLFDGTGDGGKDVVCINAVGGANNVIVKNCIFQNGNAAITTSNVASCSYWVIEDCTVYDMVVHGFSGYFSMGRIRRNLLQNTDNSAWSSGGILTLDNTTTANSDGCMIYDNIIMAGSTAVMATGVSVAANVIGNGIIRNLFGGLATKPIQVADGADLTNGNSIVYNFSHDVDADASTDEYTGVEDKMIGET